MSSPLNEFAYAKRFAGNLPGNGEPIPFQVDTRLRVAMMEMTASEVQEYKTRSNHVPIYYLVGSGSNLPLHTSLQSMGRHYFTW